MKPELFWSSGRWRGKLAIAARPRGGDWLDDEATAWRRAGVDVVVSLLENDEATQLDLGGERQAAEHNGVSFISFPIPDRGVRISFGDAASLMTPHRGSTRRRQERRCTLPTRRRPIRHDRGGRAGGLGSEPGRGDAGRQFCAW